MNIEIYYFNSKWSTKKKLRDKENKDGKRKNKNKKKEKKKKKIRNYIKKLFVY